MPAHDVCIIAVCRMCMVWLHISVNMEEVSQLDRYITLLYNDTLTLPSAEGCNKISSPVSLWHQAYNNPQLQKETGNRS